MEFVGIVPAAGVASRLNPLRYPKELLPIAYVLDESNGSAVPVPVISLSFGAMNTAGVRDAVVIISDRKPDLFGYLGDGSQFGMNLSFVQQIQPTGLLAAVDLAYRWCRFSCCTLVLPDTIVYPRTALNEIVEAVEKDSLDLALGVFPTSVPERLGPVRFASDGTINEVLDKPRKTDLRNTWALAAWSPRFFDLAHQVAGFEGGGAIPIGNVFDMAVKKGMKCKAIFFEHGSFVDIGTTEGLSRMVEMESDSLGVRTTMRECSPYVESSK